MKIHARWMLAAVATAMLAAPSALAQQGNNEGQAIGQQQEGQQQAGQDREVRRRQAIGQQQGGQQQGGQQQGGQQAVQAPVPQYWVADATIFIGSAQTAANVMTQESQLDVQAPAMLQSQAQFIVRSINRALQDMNGLLENAVETSPDAVPAIRQVTADLQAAQSLAQQLAQVTEDAQLGPTFNTNVQSLAQHLKQAQQKMTAVGKAYNAQQFTQTQSGSSGSGGQKKSGQKSGQKKSGQGS